MIDLIIATFGVLATVVVLIGAGLAAADGIGEMR
jgi:NAD-dependent SIR2 family protein deacetylase